MTLTEIDELIAYLAEEILLKSELREIKTLSGKSRNHREVDTYRKVSRAYKPEETANFAKRMCHSAMSMHGLNP